MKQDIDYEGERKRLTRWAWGVTIGYGCILAVLVSFVLFGQEGLDSFRTMSPNEVGDLLAGIAGPLAFIWLVYGYLLQGISIRQQSKQINQNSKALDLQSTSLSAQVAEMALIVKEQTEMNRIEREKLAVTEKKIAFEREEVRLKAQPNFVVSDSALSFNTNDVVITIRLSNNGAQVYDVVLKSSDLSVRFIDDIFPIFRASYFHDVAVYIPNNIYLESDSDLVFAIEFTDERGVKGENEFKFPRWFDEDKKISGFHTRPARTK